MHTILGAGGTVANALTRQLENNNNTIRLVSRREVQTGKNTTWKKADLFNLDELREATKGSTIIYLCAGIVYDAEIWKVQWPIIIKNVIAVAKENKARLIFFDNVYMYGLVDGAMKETTPYNPVSEKGEVRVAVANAIMDEVKAGTLQASIARAPDFYGTHNSNSFFDMMVLAKYAKKEMAQWIGDANKKHCFIYIEDAGKAMYLLGQNPDSDNKIWHLPTAPALTGKEFIKMTADIYNTKPSYFSLKKWMLWVIGKFMKFVAGAVEMYYQYDHDYEFDSSKFEQRFNFKPTPYAEGIKKMSETLYKAV
ncbi:NAD-dependent epimerase/dehydratase family protein [Mucilaginibacter psychrotolerans]|uniref:NAD-dependent epimerase/dehydratase family protein n=1 Tax=Mucilaginibacter psychrotolerans TaxID=1524096 RepID=A0A4Y8S9A9_9SPHI|nr:NAD-dependent epimerase/dehydratase family protein [Mucilaginibacter psychrotolerans]TFF35034.1 NAD-dependent epimerase/dehydratase family protein [Mucilaginibacter psychrotolerans]